MPLNIIPEFYEHDNFSAGWMPDLEPTAVPFEGLLDVENMLPDRTTGVLETRKGTRRFSDFFLGTHQVKAVRNFNQHYGKLNEVGAQILMVVSSNGTTTADNIQIHAIDIETGTSKRVDTVGRPWRHKAARHWGETIDNAFYGGSELDPMYCYRPYFMDGTPNPDPWDPDASMGQWCPNSWVSGTVYAVGNRVKDGAWVWVCTKAHTATDSTRPRKGRNADAYWEKVGRYVADWVSGTAYKVGDEVSFLMENNPKFPRGYDAQNRRSTFVCVQAHTATLDNQPNSGFWEPLRGPVSNVACYHGKRLFIRDSDAGTARLFYSSPVKGDGFWDPTQWTSTDITKAGAMDVRTADGDDIRGLASLGDNLIIAKRRSVWALAGINPTTWRLRRVGAGGSLGHRTLTEHEGLVYMFSDKGLLVTDGAIVQEVPGAETFRDWIRTNVDLSASSANIYRVAMWAYDQKIWIALPGGETVQRNNTCLVFDPTTQSLWKQDIHVGDAAINRKDRLDELFIASALPGGALIMQYDHPNAADQDDLGGALDINGNPATANIAWKVRTGWLSFGTGREDRRVRRLWAIFRASAKDITWKAYRQWRELATWTLTQTTGAGPVEHIEGRVMPDSHSLSFEFSGIAPTSFVGLALHTEARRKAYHVTRTP